MATQTALLCGCGATLDAHNGQNTPVRSIDSGGFCTRCERALRHDRAKFEGLRLRRLREDEFRCIACGVPEAARLVVHHRRPGRNALSYLATLCRACHKAVHLDPRPSFAFATERPELYRLWREINRRQPEQLLLLAPSAAGAVQTGLFEGAAAAAAVATARSCSASPSV